MTESIQFSQRNTQLMPSGHTTFGINKLGNFDPAMTYGSTLDLDPGVLEVTSEAVVSLRLRVEQESHLFHRRCEPPLSCPGWYTWTCPCLSPLGADEVGLLVSDAESWKAISSDHF